MTSPLSLSNTSVKVALGSIVGAGLAYIAYQSLRPKHKAKRHLVQEIDGVSPPPSQKDVVIEYYLS